MASEPLDLAALVARLRNAGLRTDIRQYLAAHELLLALAGQGHDLSDDSEALASHLGPIFCGSPEEQQLFRHEFMAWRGAPRATGAPLTPAVKKKERRHAWIVAICATVTLAGTAGTLWWKLQPSPLPPPVTDPDPVIPAPMPADPPAINSPFVVSAPTKVISGDVPVDSTVEAAVPWLIIMAGGLGAAALAFLLLWLRQKARRDHVLSRMAPDPNTRRIELNPPPPSITHIRTVALRRISAGLRRTRANEVFDLSVTATVNATANAGGFVVPVFAPRVAIPEYLVLIDRRSESDHSAQLVYGWVTQLCDQGVAADCYEFDFDPRVCREFGTQHSHRLPALLARHHRSTVLLFAESDVCIDPITSRPQEWIRWFNSLPNRVFLTMAPPYRWAAHEQRLVDSGFVVVPASPSGLQIAAAMDRNSLEAIGTGARYAREFPHLIAQDPLRWLDRNSPPEATVIRLLRALHEFLGPDGYSWLCACAIYPQISWPITLTLLDTLLPPGSGIHARKAIDEQLPSIVRLPWFRYGYMPDWLRKLLIAQLEPEKETKIRARLEQLVCGLLGSQGSGDVPKSDSYSSHLGIRIRPKALDVARAAATNSPLQDEVFLDFLAGATPDPLALRLSSLPHIGTPRPRNLATRIRERWRALNVRQPILMRSVVSMLAAVPVGVILWATLQAPKPVPVRDSDLTYYLASSNLTGSESTVAVAPNGQFLLLASPKAGRYVEIWDLPGREVRARITTVAQPFVLAFNPGSDRIAIFDADSNVYVSSLTGAVEQLTSASQSPAAARIRDLGDTLKFNADSTLLMHYNREGLTVFDTGTRRMLSSHKARIAGATFDPGNSGRIMAFSDNNVQVFDARTLNPLGAAKPLPAEHVDFSLDGKDLARRISDGQGGYQVVLEDTSSGTRRMRLTTDLTPVGWVWSGDRQLAAYKPADTSSKSANGGSGNVIYEIGSGQVLQRGDSMLPATNRLYTIRFVRSERRLPGNTYYELAERTIDLTAATDTATPTQDEPSTADKTRPPSAEENARTAKMNKEVLASLDRQVRTLAQRLISQAARQGIVIRLTHGRISGDDASFASLRPASFALHGAGRAFDYAVWSDNGFVNNDPRRMGVVGKIGKSMGLTWGGDINANDYRHFELPMSAETPRISPNVEKENQAVLGSLDRETRIRARELLKLTNQAGITMSLRPANSEIRHRSDIAQRVDFKGRAFDVAVYMPNGSWSTTDFSTLAQVGKFATGIGFEWSGDWGYGQYSHFEWPLDAGVQAKAPDGPAQTTQTSQPLRLERTEFEYPGGGYAEIAEKYSETIMRADGLPVGRFGIEFYSDSSNEGASIGRIDFEGMGAVEKESPENERDVYPSTIRRTMSISASEFAGKKVATKSIDSGILQFRLTIVNAELRTSGKEPGFDRKSLRIRVDVKPLVEFYERKRAPAKAD